MNLYIHTDLPKKGEEKMPENLSQFFEQYRGFGEASEVAQVESILEIDLSLFQNYSTDETKPVWISNEEMIALTRNFIASIHANPNYFRLVKHTGVPGLEFREEFLHAQKDKDDAKLVKLLKRWQNTPDSEFPPDTKYLSDGKLLFDLVELDKILVFLWKMGARQIQLHYH